MNITPRKTVALDDAAFCSIAHLVEASGLSEKELRDLVTCGALIPVTSIRDEPLFPMHMTLIARTAHRLRDDFELDTHGLALTMNLLQRIRELELEVSKVSPLKIAALLRPASGESASQIL